MSLQPLVRRRRRSSSAAAVLTDLQQLLVDMGLTDADLPAAYDVRFNVNASGTDVLSIDDARGAVGYGPNWPDGGGAAKCQVTGVGTNKVITSATNAWLQSAAHAAFDMGTSHAKTIVYGGTFNGANDVLCVQRDDLVSYHYLHNANPIQIVSPGGIFGSMSSGTNKSATRRLGIYTKSAYAGTPSADGTITNPQYRFEIAGRGRVLKDPGGAVATANHRLQFGRVQSGGTSTVTTNADSMRFTLVFNVDLTLAQLIAVQNWAETYHAVVFDTSKNFLGFTGNSIVLGSGAATGANSWPSQMLALGGYTGYDAPNWGIGGRTGGSIATLAPGFITPTCNPRRTKNIMIGWEIGNDVKSGLTGAQAIANLRTAYKPFHDAGGKVVLLDCMRRSDLETGSLATERANANTLIQSEAWIDLLIQASLWAEFSSDPATNPNIADGIHPNTTGNGIIAGKVDTALTNAGLK